MRELEIVREKIQNKYRVVKTDEDLKWNRAIDLCTNIINAHMKHMNDGWVSVEERVPKEEGYKVLVCSKKGNIDTGIYSPYTKQWFIGNISALGKDIIAWRPLPEPYHPERSEHDR